MCWKKTGDINKAIELAHKGLEFEPQNKGLFNTLGYYYMKIQKFELSLKYLQKTLDIEPEIALTNGNLGNCLCELK